MTNYREILRLSSLGYNNTEIADVCGCSRTTVISVLRQAEAVGVGYPLPEGMSERDLINALRPPVSGKPVYRMPDYAKVHKEYQRKCVTLNRLWLEYCEDCQKSGELPYQLTQFKKYYREYTVKAGATMHLDHKPGEIMQVDWAGDTAKVIDTDTGELIPAYLFVAVLPYSGYAYVEAFYSMDQECWTEAHVNAFRFFGGVARIVQCDNLKTGVTSHGKDEIVLNKVYISVDKQNYSVPYEYIKQKVDVRITRTVIEVFFNGIRICSHPRLYGRTNQYSTVEDHMPEKHQQYLQWNGERFRKWAAKIGVSTSTVIDALLSGYRVEQQGYKACMGILKLADKYSPERLENACFKALTYASRPSFKNVQTILSSGQDRIEPEKPAEKLSSSQYGFTRGDSYYEGRQD